MDLLDGNYSRNTEMERVHQVLYSNQIVTHLWSIDF